MAQGTAGRVAGFQVQDTITEVAGVLFAVAYRTDGQVVSTCGTCQIQVSDGDAFRMGAWAQRHVASKHPRGS